MRVKCTKPEALQFERRHKVVQEKILNCRYCDRYYKCRIKPYGFTGCYTQETRILEIQEKNMQEDDGTIRKFETGATRDTAVGKLDYEAGLSPLVLQRYMQYLDKHREQSDGSMRDFDNWQKGIGQPVYMKSMLRHTIDTWLIHRGFAPHATNQDIEEALCAELFNTMGMLFEVLKNKETKA